MDQKENDFGFFMHWFVRAGNQMNDPHYFQLPISGRETPVFRERVYCYELYHQIRVAIDENFPYKLDGEVDKIGHPIIPGDKKPDFVVHIPGDMDNNLVVIEVKPVTADESDFEADLNKLDWLLEKGNYFKAIMLVYGNELHLCS